MKNKKLFNKIIASALSVVMGIQYTTSVLPQSVYAAYIDEDYVLYSSDDTVINTENAVINGSVYTGDKFDYRGSSVCYVNELLNANEKSGSVTPVKSEYRLTDASRELMPCIHEIKMWALKWKIHNPACAAQQCFFCKL